MARNTLIIVAVVLGGLFTLLYLKAQNAVTITRARTVLPAPVQTRVTGLPPTQASSRSLSAGSAPSGRGLTSSTSSTSSALPSREGLTTNREAMRRDLLLQIQSLQQTLSAKQQDLAAKEQALKELREPASANQPSRQQAGVAIDGRADEVATLSANLDQMEASREALRLQEEEALRQRENQARLAAVQLDTQIQQQEQVVLNLQRQLDEWSRNHKTVAGLPLPNPDLQNGLNEQNQRLAALRQQKLALASDHHQQNNAIMNLGQQAREELRSQEVDLRGQIFSLQSEIRRIQYAQKQSENSSQNQASRIQGVQQDYQQTSRQIRELRSTLRSKQSELKKLE